MFVSRTQYTTYLVSSSRSFLKCDMLSLLLYLAVAQVGAGAELDWPGPRGISQQAHGDATPLVDSWREEGPAVSWTADLGQGYSSCAIGQGRVFTQYQDLFGQYLVCFDLDSGKQLWRERYALPYDPAGLYPGPRSTPTLWRDAVYCVDPDGRLACHAAATGAVRWRLSLQEKFGLQGAEFGYAASPIIDEDRLYLPCGGTGASVVAIDPLNGKVLWAAGDEPASYASILPIELGGRRVLVAFLRNAVVFHEASSGAILGRFDLSHGYDEHSTSPIFREGRLLLAFPFRGGATQHRLALTESVSGKPKVEVTTAWFNATFSNDTASSVLAGDTLYGFDIRDPQAKSHRPSRGEFRALDWETGKELWSTKAVGHATAIVADNKLLLFCDRGELILARAARESYQELARTKVFEDEICWTAPAMAKGRLLLRSPSRLVCIDLRRDPPDAAREPARVADVRRSAHWVSTELGWLLGGEREFLFDRPCGSEHVRWFLASLVCVFLPAMLLAAGISRLKNGDRAQRSLWRARAACVLAVILGLAATPLLNRTMEAYFFTWPASLFALFQLAVLETGSTESKPSRLCALAWLGGLVLAGSGYYFLCLRLGVAHEPMFLTGFIAAAIPAWLAARAVHGNRSAVLAGGWALVAFGAYYAGCVAVTVGMDLLRWRMG
jgi:outer membrane protein assembly factor BamB